MSGTAEQTFPWRSVVVSVFLPTLLFAIGEGAIIPIIPVVASDLGAGLAGAGFIAAMILVGELIGDIPAGALVARIGERTAMIGGSVLSIVGVLIAIYAPEPWVLGVGIFLIGLATAVFALARHAFMTSFVPVVYRARALSSLGGTFRLGYLIGPFLTAAVIQVSGNAVTGLWVHFVCCALAAGVLIVLRDPESSLRSRTIAGDLRSGEAEVAAEAHGLFRTIYLNRRVLLTLGTGSALISALRASRFVILPLWAVSIGLDATTTAIIIGVASGIDFALFYLGGWIMDRFGRLWTAVPSILGLGIGHLVLAFTHDSPANVQWFIGVALLFAIANGIGAGILMTLGADLADPQNPAPFLGAWRFTNDFGGAVSPLLVAGITAAASLAIASGFMGVLGILGAVILRVYVPRYSKRP
jgi:MFS family permease